MIIFSSHATGLVNRNEDDTMNPTELIARLRGIDPAALADADKSIRVIAPEIRPVRTGLTLLGPAYTIRCTNDFFAIIAALEDAGPGDVLVVDTQGSTCAVDDPDAADARVRALDHAGIRHGERARGASGHDFLRWGRGEPGRHRVR